MAEKTDQVTPSMQALKVRYGFDTTHARKELVCLAGNTAGSPVLDIGTGSAWMAIVLSERGTGSSACCE